MKKWMMTAALCILAFFTLACGGTEANKPASAPQQAQTTQAAQTAAPKEETQMNKAGKTKLLGGISPEAALEYMKKTPNLVIVEVNTAEWKLSTGFTGALWIPHTEMAERYGEIPKGRPVLLHCGGGIVSKDAYKILQEKRPDIPELGYIAGAPLVSQYNEWKAQQK